MKTNRALDLVRFFELSNTILPIQRWKLSNATALANRTTNKPAYLPPAEPPLFLYPTYPSDQVETLPLSLSLFTANLSLFYLITYLIPVFF